MSATDECSLVLEILHVCGHAHMQSHVSTGKECYPNVSFRIQQGNGELWNEKVTATSVAAAIAKFLLGTCDCTVDSDVGNG